MRFRWFPLFFLFLLSPVLVSAEERVETSVLKVGFVEFRGSWAIDEKILRRASNLPIGSEITEQMLSEARERVQQTLVAEGYLAAAVTTSLMNRRGGDDYIVRFDVAPGDPYRLGEFRVVNELKPDIQLIVARESLRYSGANASAANVKAALQRILLGLRNEGYLRASIMREAATINPEQREVTTSFRVFPRKPLSVVFFGNKVFLPYELLAPLHLETRTVPFTTNAIPNLLRGIRRMYQERGYFFAEAKLTAERTDGERDLYEISIEEGPWVKLDQNTFTGASVFSVDELRAMMQTKESSSWPDWIRSPHYLLTDEVAADLEQLEEAYHELGYLQAKLDSQVQVSEDLGNIELVISIEEGSVTRIQELYVDWQNADQAPSVKDNFQLTLEVGAPLAMKVISAEAERLERELSTQGYPNGRVNTEVNAELGSVRFIVSPREHVRIGKISIEGNEVTDLDFIEQVLRTEQRIGQGEPWSSEALAAGQRTLLRTGLFRNVTLQPTDGVVDSTAEALTVRVDERDTGVLGVGASLNSEDGLHLTGEIGQQNMFGFGQSLMTGVDIYLKNSSRLFDAGRIRGEYRHPYFIERDNTLIIEGYVQHSVETVAEFSFDRVGVSPYLRRKLSEHLDLDLGYQLFEERTFDVESDVIASSDDVGTRRYSLVRTTLQLDQRDDPYNPRRGFFSAFEGRFAGDTLGSEVSYWGVSLQHSIYFPMGEDLVWANSFRSSLLRPYGDTEAIPLGERIYLGGRNSLRGFSRNKIGPRGVEGNIAGGDTSVVVNSELQVDLNQDVVGVLFLDLGQSFLVEEGEFTGDPQELSGLRYSPGIGIRYRTPIGPLSAEYGFALDREFGEREGRFNFGIGGVF